MEKNFLGKMKAMGPWYVNVKAEPVQSNFIMAAAVKLEGGRRKEN